MKKLSYLFIGLLLIGATQSFAQGEKRKSPAMKAEGKIGATEVMINYSSPSVKGREIYGDLVPFDKVWRAGANEATTVQFSKDVMVNGKKLAAGTYAFFVTPSEEGEWMISFNKEAKQWGAYKHDKSKDALVVGAKTKKIKSVEKLTYGIDGSMIYLDWSTTRLMFEVK